jgi:hypothetical protein
MQLISHSPLLFNRDVRPRAPAFWPPRAHSNTHTHTKTKTEKTAHRLRFAETKNRHENRLFSPQKKPKARGGGIGETHSFKSRAARRPSPPASCAPAARVRAARRRAPTGAGARASNAPRGADPARLGESEGKVMTPEQMA